MVQTAPSFSKLTNHVRAHVYARFSVKIRRLTFLNYPEKLGWLRNYESCISLGLSALDELLRSGIFWS